MKNYFSIVINAMKLSTVNKLKIMNSVVLQTLHHNITCLAIITRKTTIKRIDFEDILNYLPPPIVSTKESPFLERGEGRLLSRSDFEWRERGWKRAKK